MTDELVSVIVPTKNSAKHILNCLRSIRSQVYPSVEIIVVDNDSTDRTQDIAKVLADKVLDKGPERSVQRNFGARNASGGYLLFIDSDMELTANVVDECVKAVHEESAHAVIIPEMSVGEGFWAACRALEKSCYIGDETIEAARFFGKDVFWSVGGYDEEIAGGGEDWDLHIKVKDAGYKIVRVHSMIKHNEGRINLLCSMRKKYYYAKTLEQYVKKHPKEARQQLTLMRPAFLRNWRRLLKDPVHALGMFILKTCELGAGAVGFLCQKRNLGQSASADD